MRATAFATRQRQLQKTNTLITQSPVTLQVGPGARPTGASAAAHGHAAAPAAAAAAPAASSGSTSATLAEWDHLMSEHLGPVLALVQYLPQEVR